MAKTDTKLSAAQQLTVDEAADEQEQQAEHRTAAQVAADKAVIADQTAAEKAAAAEDKAAAKQAEKDLKAGNVLAALTDLVVHLSQTHPTADTGLLLWRLERAQAVAGHADTADLEAIDERGEPLWQARRRDAVARGESTAVLDAEGNALGWKPTKA